MIVLAIDPGNGESAYCLINSETLHPVEFGEVQNKEILSVIRLYSFDWCVIGCFVLYGNGRSAKKEKPESIEWAEKFSDAAWETVEYISEVDVKLHLCENSYADWPDIRRALIDRFAKHDFKTGKGTKKSPDFFYGFKKGIWKAYALGLTYIETKT